MIKKITVDIKKDGACYNCPFSEIEHKSLLCNASTFLPPDNGQYLIHDCTEEEWCRCTDIYTPDWCPLKDGPIIVSKTGKS